MVAQRLSSIVSGLVEMRARPARWRRQASSAVATWR